MSNKLCRDTFSHEEIIKIADILNADVRVTAWDSGKDKGGSSVYDAKRP